MSTANLNDDNDNNNDNFVEPPPSAVVANKQTDTDLCNNNNNNNNKTILPESLTKLNPPSGAYFIDQFKCGAIIDNRPILNNRIVFGRARDCDITLDHPSISRYHAVLLWSPKNEDSYEKGLNNQAFWYLVDCGSTHGTVCNKTVVDAGKTIKLSPNNNVFRFGASTRFFTLVSNLDDDNPELNAKQPEANLKITEKNNEGCSWGMELTDCDDDSEETGDSIALKSVILALKDDQSNLQLQNENAYSESPYKCLQTWFEREGYNFDYKVDTINSKFKCTLELPVDGQWIPMEGSLSNKKKDAIFDACLKCCKVLDQAQLLFPWQKQNARQESKQKYENDDDIIDETVKVNKRLKKETTINNYETLNIKWKEINEELIKLKIKLATIGLDPGVKPNIPDDLTDSLDIYLSTMQTTKYGLSLNDKIEKSNLKMKIKQLEAEQVKIEKLIEIAKPSEILIATSKDVKQQICETNKDTRDIQIEIKIPDTKLSSTLESVNNKRDDIANEKIINETVLKTEPNMELNPVPIETRKEEKAKTKIALKTARKMKQESIIKAIENEKLVEKKKLQTKSLAIESESDFIDWVPPASQSGDGKTHLNNKFGY